MTMITRKWVGCTSRFDRVQFSDLNKKSVIGSLFDILAGWHGFCTVRKDDIRGSNFALSDATLWHRDQINNGTEGNVMAYTVVGKSVSKVDAIAKVTGKAKYTDDFFERDMLVGKILHSQIGRAHV